MKREIEISNSKKLLSCICAPFLAACILEWVVLMLGFTPNLLFVNYLMEALFLFFFRLSCKNKYECYREEPNLKITKYFWVELAIHGAFIVAAVVQSSFNVRLYIDEDGLHYVHNFFFISAMILVLHIVYMCVDYYASEKAAAIRYCRRVLGKK